jgi:hypothetical protein
MHRLLRLPVLFLTLAASSLLADTPAASTAAEPAKKTIERLNVRDLKAGEKVVVTYVSAGPGYLLRRIYSIEGGAETKFTAIEQESVYDGKRRELKSDLEPIGETVLTTEEKFGVENYFTFLRMEYQGNCYAYDKLTLDHFRDGKLIGTESFHDKTCVATWFTRKNGQVVRKGDSFKDFPVDLLWSMVPVLLVEQRLWEEIRAEAKDAAK